jgi:hypothetical protein
MSVILRMNASVDMNTIPITARAAAEIDSLLTTSAATIGY